MVDHPDQIDAAEFLVLPGVGAFAAAMQRLREKDFVAPLRRRIANGRPTLAICLGMQLFAEWSEEAPGEKGLGIWPVGVRRFDDGLPCPQIGWNAVECPPEARLLSNGAAYFANSYALEEIPGDWNIAWTEYGRRFPAAAEKSGVLACQFHPELSSAWGETLLRRWWEAL
jgi:imidazole glycerol phosphate synthase glutamine amidotransferase subunit